MNEEYLAAKANLCLNQAEKDLKQEEIAKAIKNLERANSALSRLFGLEGEAEELSPEFDTLEEMEGEN